jgi:hypothetical protein
MSSINYVKNSAKKNQAEFKQLNLFKDIMVIIKDPLPEEYDLKTILKKIENNIPRHLFNDLDIVYVGAFKELKARQVESAYMDGAIYLSNEQPSEENIYNSIIHELAHNVEKVFEYEVYGDDKILEEFLSKRKQLRSILESNNLYCDSTLYLRPELTRDFDNFLFKTVGYDRLSLLSVNLFISPYSATSLREYFASGFEHYFADENPEYIKKISPKLYNKIIALTKIY